MLQFLQKFGTKKIVFVSLGFVVAVLLIVFSQQDSGQPRSQEVFTESEFGSWIWTPVSAMDENKMREYIDTAVSKKINVLYLTVDEYLDISDSGDEKAVSHYEESLNKFIALSKEKGVAVDAEGGGRDWAKPEHAWKAHKLLQFVADYNSRHEYDFRGIQYDIEPYLLPEYEENKKEVLTAYVELVDALSHETEKFTTDDKQVQLSFVIPHFYDASQQWTPKVTLNGREDYSYGHIVRSLNRLPKAQVIVMAYRNFIDGTNGALHLALEEVRFASRNASNVKIVVAQETGKVEPDYVTFYGRSSSELASQVAVLQNDLSSERSFGGIAIHYLDTFAELK